MWLFDIGEVCCTNDVYFEWIIKDFYEYEWNDNLYLRSPLFAFANDSHYIFIDINEEENIHLTFSKSNGSLTNRLKVKLGMIKRYKKKQWSRWRKTDECGNIFLPSWMTRSEMFSSLHKGHLILYSELKILGEKKSVSVLQELNPRKEKFPDYGSHEEETESKTIKKMLEDLKSLLATGEDSDVIIKVQGKEFPAHRTILRARCPVFKSMFSHDTVEKESGVVDIDDCDPDIFPDFLTYVYTGSTRHVHSENMFGLYAAADKYCVDELREACASFMESNVSVEAFCDVTSLALRHGEKRLIESTADFFCKNVGEIVKTPKWEAFLLENPIEGNKLFIRTLPA